MSLQQIEPDLLYSVLCDEVRREDNGKWILLGLFEQITVASFPTQHPQCCIVNKWLNGSGTFYQTTKFIDEDDQVLIQSEMLPFELESMESSFTAVQMFAGLNLEKPGKIWVEIYLGAELKQRFPIRINELRR